jgi:hypothetical protein
MALPFSRQDCSLSLKTGSTRMIKKQKDRQSNPPSKQDPRALCILQKPTESPPDALAHTVIRPTVQAATTLMNYNKILARLLSIPLSMTWRPSVNLPTMET